ncbi:hypothetical protein [Hymenobacter sp.]|jgi:hypothetical protein|uniref:hypothetical protein n=1 Tax=Hymenobacter sp. TaxID=1898978 RepID=UPI002ED9E9FB
MRYYFLFATLLVLPIHSFFGEIFKISYSSENEILTIIYQDTQKENQHTTSVPSRVGKLFSLIIILPDTLPGETHLTNLMAKGMCEQIALESRHQDLAVLTRAQGTGLIEDMLAIIILQDSTEFKAFILKAPDADAAMQRLTIHAILRLASTCPTASKLLTQMGVQMGNVDTKLTVPQEQVLQTISHGLCGQLSTADAERALDKRSAPERIELYQQAVHDMMLTHGQEIGTAFGSDVFTNKQMESKLWQNLDRLMFEECPAFTAVLRVDRGLARMQDTTSTESSSTKTTVTPTQRKRKK